MSAITNVLIVGVGGQGTLLASRVLGDVAMRQGYDVKMSEVHGMAQRGGSVVTHVRFGNKVYSPLVDACTADYIVAFEWLEALRYLHFLKKGGLMIANTRQILPMPVITGVAQYPDDIEKRIKEHCRLQSCDALSIAADCGNVKAVNTVLLGKLAQHLEFTKEEWLCALQKTIPAKALEVNIKAFEAGLKP
ncbi:MAG: indolepyruvate oxidoreductase subunit beta [Christensenellales bacterium]